MLTLQLLDHMTYFDFLIVLISFFKKSEILFIYFVHFVFYLFHLSNIRIILLSLFLKFIYYYEFLFIFIFIFIFIFPIFIISFYFYFYFHFHFHFRFHFQVVTCGKNQQKDVASREKRQWSTQKDFVGQKIFLFFWLNNDIELDRILSMRV